MKHVFSAEWLLAKQRAVRPGSWTAYLLAIAIVGTATALHLALAPWLVGSQFAIVLPVAIVTSFLCEARAGFLALAMSLASVIVFILPAGTLSEHAVGIGLYTVFGSVIVGVISALRAAIARADRLNASLRANEGKFLGLMESAPDAMVIETGDRRIGLANSQAEALFGYRRDELEGQSVEMLIPERDRAAYAARHKAILERPDAPPAVVKLELTLLSKDGSEIPVEISASPLHTEDRGSVCIAIRDITERRAAEEALRLSEERHRALAGLLIDALDASDDGIALYDSDDRLVLTNNTMKKNPAARPDLFVPGRKYEEIIRAYWAGTEFAQDKEAFERYLAADIATHQAGDGTRSQHRVSKDIWVVNRDFRTRDGGVLHTATDVSALVSAKEAAEQANLSKSRFLAAASHDLRQPLQTMALLNSVLQKTVSDPQVRAIIDQLGASVDSMSDMLNTLLELNQLEAGVISPNIENFVIGDLLERVCAELRLHAEVKRLDLRHVRCGAVVRSDPMLFEQIIRNLLSNAIKYTNQGKVLVGCRHRGETLRIEVLDTGLGIAKDQLKAIFEEFHQVDNPARDRRLGLGLGLTIVQRVSGLLSHPITVRSLLGKGSAFSIEVPLGKRSALAPTSMRKPAQSAKPTRILLVDDDAGVLASLRMLLELHGHTVVAVEDAAHALAHVRQANWQPEVIVSDLNLPGGVDGLELIELIRSEFDGQIPAILLTGDVMPETRERLSTATSMVLNKPVDAAALIAAIEECRVVPPNTAR